MKKILIQRTNLFLLLAAVTIALTGCGSSSEEKTVSDAVQVMFDFSESNFGEVDPNGLTLNTGELVSITQTDHTVIVKAKIKSQLTNKLTVDQNSMNVYDLIKEHGFDTCEELQYWAVADMSDGTEAKVISFTVPKEVIADVADNKIVASDVMNHCDDVWIHPSLS